MSAIFQRPLCEMGRAYDFAFRPTVGDPGPGFGGGCDTRPHRVELFSAAAEPADPQAAWQPFQVCEEHEEQLRTVDRGIVQKDRRPSRFRGGKVPSH
jgi:hypothetical protein